MTPPVKRRPSGHHHGDLRNALERAALELVAEKGPHGFSLNEASRRAGVSVAAPYKHFADREALLAALAVTGYREQRERFAGAVSALDDPADQLAAFAAAYVRFAAERPALFDVTFYAGLDKARHPELAEAGDALLATLLPVAARITSGESAAFDLLLRISSAAHGLAVFLRQGLFGVAADALEETAHRAAHTARALIADAKSSAA
ncbi:TetR/AcrR family transcriptional regulator [Catenulispora sp. NF23]|uniref:TetR/AcrR family transcriptional regulator n=1 Tax=Catenulispora pinistramenti TaxID=2705254 RepID=A0ABS5L8P9_9ACTN|nr:TetR/AcrR family transcriptional regulator [Catenulispora pinistramenti]MBS2540173.1 TetR/AcrR family transcriptional regulator [Catenulispora pinistramenti]MBS2554716.1 TetR/AcrR family transcriptional regulator [Catenulispora pinistramenti]